ncbi:hypothetical protein K443DRAFT_114141 [Laccaria amethystina LaAM-08-1]|uniref:Uncharacterized protein n=1 Tax=Laccaria amethystina LaAM-08-1 TaxID=1095629 RepID=A0A0C9WUD3_9AGAR|nr:hypothetical protein K443DRAFT_114141 [Laccaria amethystina LaAM-08-1]
MVILHLGPQFTLSIPFALLDLLDEAVHVVLEAMHGCTPLDVKATAGLRLLLGSQSADILTAVEGRIYSYPFQL